MVKPHDDQTRAPPVVTERVIDLEQVAARRARPGVTRSLLSLDVEERRLALRDLVRWGIVEDDVGPVSELLLDPDPGVRRTAAEALLPHAARVDDAVVRRSLQDPVDEVRGAAVALSAARNLPHVDELISLLSSMRWPEARRAALGALPRIIHSGGLPEHNLSALLRAVGTPHVPPVEAERETFAELARAVGRDPLVDALAHTDERRLGAVRLLMIWGARLGLRTVAALASDPLPEIQEAARAAVVLLAEPAAEEPSQRGTVDVSAPERVTEREVTDALIRSLQDPDPIVRDRAWSALAISDWDTLLDWVRESLRADDDELAALAATVSERLMLSQVAASILERGARVPEIRAAPFLGALASFDLDPAILTAMLWEVDQQARPRAVRMVVTVGGPEVLPQLPPLLLDAFGPVRRAVLEALAGLAEGEAAALAALQTDPSPAVRSAAIRVLERSDASRRLEALGRAIRDPDTQVRAEGLRVLAAGLGPDSLPLLMSGLEDAEEIVWTAALEHLSDPRREPADIWDTLRRCTPDQRQQLLDILRTWERRALTELTLTHLRSPDAADRVLAVEIGRLAGGREALQGIIEALSDPVAEVRVAAARALEDPSHPVAAAALGDALGDPDMEVRTAAARALGAIDERTATIFLVRALGDPEPRVRAEAAGAFARLRPDPAALEGLVESLVRAKREITPELDALLDRESGKDNLLARLVSLDPENRLQAVDIVAALAGDAAVDALTRALGDPDRRVRIRVLERLGDLSDPRTRGAVERTARADPVPEVVDLAWATLGRLPLQEPTTS